MATILSNYTANGSSTTDEFGTFLTFHRLLQGDVAEGLQVVANGTPNMTVNVSTGTGRITTGTYPTDYGYWFGNTSSYPVAISTAAASARIDYIVGYVDKSVAGSTSGANVNNSNNVIKFAAVAGTPSGSPVVPTVSQIQTAIGAANPYIIVGQLAVGANVTQITNANITDKRTFIRVKQQQNLPGTQLRLGIAKKNTTGILLTVSYATYATVTATSGGGECEADVRFIFSNGNSGSVRDVFFKVQCDGVDVSPTDIRLESLLNSGGGSQTSASFIVSSTPTAGSHTWTFLAYASAASSVSIEQAVLKVTEIVS
ncbi:hypothetical protein QFZ60_001605 [Arthrobacter sp. B2I5]|uniref:hypothetical protein n=1 Tax=Arthrobacter sp. B2I5 TaxID=3042266 RepID=UPI0027892468|nr:hypothetical protein [Arthrobacter sp. B2I5]MDQ0825432.1 hypothetical protein [Arthrobacter sp. B2I5]